MTCVEHRRHAVSFALAERSWPRLPAAMARNSSLPHRRFLGDGCMMEASPMKGLLPGRHPGPVKLIAFYDDNGISIDMRSKGEFTDEHTPKHFRERWLAGDPATSAATTPNEIRTTLDTARKATTLICCKTVISYSAT